jgi:hypothetical protein
MPLTSFPSLPEWLTRIFAAAGILYLDRLVAPGEALLGTVLP